MKNLLQFLMLFILNCMVLSAAYSQKKAPTEQDYDRWQTIGNTKISPNGLWCSYQLVHQSKMDTIFVQQIETGKKYSFANGTTVQFSPSSNIAIIQLPENSIALLDLTMESINKFDNVRKYEFSKTGEFCVFLKSVDDLSQCLVYNKHMKKVLTVQSCRDFAISDDGKLAIDGASGLTIYDLRKNNMRTNVTTQQAATYKSLLWSSSSIYLAFLELKDQGHNISTFNTVNGELKTINDAIINKVNITDEAQTPLIFSDDEKRLFFQYTNIPAEIVDDSIVEVWESNTKLVYPAAKIQGDIALQPKLAAWNMDEDQVSLVATDGLPLALLTRDQKFALTYSHYAYEPQNKLIGDVDLYITEIKTGDKSLLLSKHSVSPFEIGGSPSGQYINYYKNKNWYVYDVLKKKHINLTENLTTSFEDSEHSESSMPQPYLAEGWSSDSKYLIVHDEYDIWLLSPDTKKKTRITRGAEQNIKFRICPNIYGEKRKLKSTDFITQTFDLQKGLLLTAISNSEKGGYFKWDANGLVKKIAYDDFKFSDLKKSADGKKIIFLKESFEIPPTLYQVNTTTSQPKVIYQSNPHYLKYLSGKSELITYKNTAGIELKSALFYPAGYQNNKQYPMIVYIYTNESSSIHEYVNPTMYHPIGFAPSNYTNDGYIILKPDIKYTIGNPGPSILDCVSNAVKEVERMGIVLKDRIGLLGHSYGGHEVALLLTKTSKFAAAIASAAVTDMISSYLSVTISNGMKMDWRFESQQFRMGSTPFNNLEGYLENSAVISAGKIATPLLHWTGKEDPIIDWKQGVELHLALRRLNKPNTFLVYPNEKHILENPLARYDLSIRNKNWFNYYLKDIPFPLQ